MVHYVAFLRMVYDFENLIVTRLFATKGSNRIIIDIKILKKKEEKYNTIKIQT